MKFALSVLILSCSLNVLAFQQEKIEDLLSKDLDAIILEDKVSFEITSKSSAVKEVFLKVLVFNKKGDNLAQLVDSYDENSTLKINKGYVYDLTGEEIFSSKRSDIQDVSYVSGGTLYQDDRLKILDLSQNKYPYIAEYSYKKEFDYLFHIPNFRLYPQEDVAVVHSEFTLAAPDEYSPRFKSFNISDTSYQRTKENGLIKHHWVFKHAKRPEKFYYGKAAEENLPMIITSPSKFEYDGYAGDFSTWDSYGQWISQLNAGKDDLPAELVTKLKSLVNGVSSEKEKIKRIYNYLQENTRYVSVQLGIGGYQPYPASHVEANGYGDCKGLSNYTKAMLEAVGVKANYVLIYGGSNPPSLFGDFPASRFNHAVLAVPMKQDTVWLECTSQTNPFGYMGSFTGNRQALMITESGASIVNTPKYDESTNRAKNELYIKINESGEVNADLSTQLNGMEYESYGLSFLLNKGKVEKEDWLRKYAPFNDFDITSLEVMQIENLPKVEVKAQLALRNFTRKNSKRMFLEVNPFSVNTQTVFGQIYKSEKNKFFEQKYGFTQTDSVVVELPKGHRIEYSPKSTSFESEFGNYNSSIEIDEDKVVFTRTVKIFKGDYSIDKFDDYKDF